MFEISTELSELASSVIEKHQELKTLSDSNCRIAYQYSDKTKTSNGKTVYADTTKVSDKVKSIANVDFIITFYKPSCVGLNEEKKEILMLHELRHVGYDPATGKCRIVPHDVEDFEEIIKDYGMKWIL